MDNSRQGIVRHNDMIRRHGDWVWYYPAVKCPCGSSDRPILTCVNCRGTGILYLQGQEIRGIMTDVKMDKRLIESGIAVPGDMTFSQEIGTVELTEWDMLKMQIPQPYEGQLVIRGEDDTDQLWYEAGEVQRCVSIDPMTSQLVEYAERKDFALSKKVLTWLPGGQKPTSGQKYSIKYTAYYEWIVFLPPTLRYERGTNLGQRVVLKKRHIILQGAE